jgi:hypothetical protein
MCRRRVTYHWKALNKGYNFASELIAIEGLHSKLWAPKVTGVPVLGISGLPLWSPGTQKKKPFGCGPCGEVKNIL